MFTRKPKVEDEGLNKAIDALLAQMDAVPSESEEYSKMVDQLSKLYSLRETPQRVSPDTLAIVLGNLLGIVVIVGHERAHIVTSKAINFLLKLR